MSDTPPQVEDPPEAELTDFERSFMDVISSRYPVDEGTGDPGSAEGDEPTAAPGDDGEGEGPEPESPETEPEGAPGEGEAPEGEDGQSSSAFTLSGVDYTPEQLNEAIQVHDWFARLDPGQVQAIDALVSGQYRLAPMQEAAPQPQPAVSPGQTPSPRPSVDEDEGEWLDPRARQEIEDLRGQIEYLQQSVAQNLTPVIQHQQDTDFQARLDAISRASEQFKTHYELEDNQMQALESAIVESQILPSLASRYGGLTTGMSAALEMFFWATPDYRDNYLRKQQDAVAAESATNEAASLRKQQLTALSASGGSAPRREPVPSNPADRQQAMTAEIAAAMNGNGTV